MAIQIDYFTAASDELAASTAEYEAGVRAESSDVVTSQDVDPGLGLGYLNEILTGVAVGEFVGGDWPAFVAASSDEQKFVLEVDPAFVTLMSTQSGPFDDLAQQWADVDSLDEAEEWNPRPRDLTDFLQEFVALCARANEAGQSVYCWLWP